MRRRGSAGKAVEQEPSVKEGLIQVYTGDGKGKTTAAFGQAVRAAGQGLKVWIIQFLKGGRETGERIALKEHPLIRIEAFGRAVWVDRGRPAEEDKKLAQQALARAFSILQKGEVDLLILDEVNVAIAYGLLSVNEVLGLLNRKPKSVEVILTGREAPPQILERADLITEMKKVKHPAEKKIAARRGIEY
ncbi:MAG: cob(I)yrinic acid a,c-diamide adenosyltransferase [candidate division NC10 bacterium]|nr:cob(I)yrinic acid a,c-diamide adenosyltransferase [candidate division NC10 bacterium]